jgi:hypothetical protein
MKTHWKKAFKSDYLSSSDIDDKDLVLTIKNVRYQECMTQSGKKFCNVAHFAEQGIKPMILNVGNSKIVKSFAGNKTHLEDWNNIKIQVYVDPKVRFGNDTVEGLRIRTTPPKSQSQLPKIEAANFNNALEYLKNGKTIDDLKKIRSFDKAMETKLINALNA